MDDFKIELVNKFALSISDDDKDKKELTEAFTKYIKDAEEYFKTVEAKNINNKQETLEQYLNSIETAFANLNIVIKKRYLLKDACFDEISVISQKIFDLAIEKADGKKLIETIDVDELYKRIEELEKGVKEYNLEEAKKLISETVLDISFIKKEKPTICSIRMYHYKFENKGK